MDHQLETDQKDVKFNLQLHLIQQGLGKDLYNLEHSLQTV